MIATIHNEPEFSELFMSYLLSRNSRIEEDLIDQLFNSSEKRLARQADLDDYRRLHAALEQALREWCGVSSE